MNDEHGGSEESEDDREEGFFLMWRRLFTSRYYLDPFMLQMLHFCIKHARFSGDRVVNMRVGRGWKQVPLKVGQFITGRKKIAEELHIPERTAWDRLRRMEEWGTITIAVDDSGQFSVVTLINWGTYQDVEKAMRKKPAKDRRRASRQGKADDNTPVVTDLRSDVNAIPPTIPPTISAEPSPSFRQASATKETTILNNDLNQRGNERGEAASPPPAPAEPAKPKVRSKKTVVPVPDFTLRPDVDSPEAREGVRTWLTYKHERREAFTPTGFKAHLGLIANRIVEHGWPGVWAAMEKTMAGNWSGFDKPDFYPAKKVSRIINPGDEYNPF